MKSTALDPLFGAWFAGLCDGEGHFEVRKGTRRREGDRAWMCAFHLLLRADDEDVLEEIRERTGLGSILWSRRTTVRGWNPSKGWHVFRKAEVAALADIFRQYPLRTRKARDCQVWQEAVDAWLIKDYDRMAALGAQIRQVRKWSGVDLEPVAVEPSPQLALIGRATKPESA